MTEERATRPPVVLGEPRVLAGGLVFPEGPRWHDGALYVADIHAHAVVRIGLDGRSEVVGRVDKPNGLGFLPDGTLLAVSMHARRLVAIGAGTTSVYADLSGLGGDFLNDMVVAPDGAVYCGLRSWRATGAPPPDDDRVVLVRPDGRAEVAATGMTGPNGMVLTPDGDLIVAETHARRLTRLTPRPTGLLSSPRTFADLSGGILGNGRKAFPDGICLDTEGAVWVGTAISGEFLRVDAAGRLTDRLAPAAAWATACMLGGPDGRLLFMATCHGSLEALAEFRHRSMDEEGDGEEYLAWARDRCRGFVEVVEVAVPHAGRP